MTLLPQPTDSLVCLSLTGVTGTRSRCSALQPLDRNSNVHHETAKANGIDAGRISNMVGEQVASRGRTLTLEVAIGTTARQYSKFLKRFSIFQKLTTIGMACVPRRLTPRLPIPFAHNGLRSHACVPATPTATLGTRSRAMIQQVVLLKKCPP